MIMQPLAKRLFYLLRLMIAVTMLWYLASSGSIEWSSFSGLAKAWRYTLVAIGLFVSAVVLQALRLRLLINAGHFDLSFLAAIKLTFIGWFFSTYLPGAAGGDVVKIYYASKGNQQRRAEVITIVLLDRFIGLFSLLTLPLILAPFFVNLIAIQPALQAVLGASLGLTCGIIVAAYLGARVELDGRQPLHRVETNNYFRELLMRILRTLHLYRNRMGFIFGALVLSYAVQILMVGVSMAVAQAINPAGADPKMLLLVPMGYLASALPITPGGLGVGEVALESLFTMSGLGGGAETLLGWRLIMLIVGLLGLVFYLKGEERFVFSQRVKELTNS